MRQNITREQWEELSEEKQKVLKNYLMEKEVLAILKSGYPYLNIGQMIEFLDQDELNECLFSIGGVQEKENFCDALWEAVKYKLKNK